MPEIRTLTLGIDSKEEVEKYVDFKGLSELASVKFDMPIQTIRINTSPIEKMSFKDISDVVPFCVDLEKRSRKMGIDHLGGYFIDAIKLDTRKEHLISLIPQIFSKTERTGAFVQVGSTGKGISLRGARLASKTCLNIARRLGARSNRFFGTGCNIRSDTPFFPGSYHEGKNILTVGVSGADVVLDSVTDSKNLREASLRIKENVFSMFKKSENIGKFVAKGLKVSYGGVDLSIAPEPIEGRSMGEVLQELGIDQVGAHGSIFALSFILNSIEEVGKKISKKAGYCGIMMPVLEDYGLIQAVGNKSLSIDSLLSMLSVCMSGLDTIPLPGDIPVDTLAGIILDTVAIGVQLNKPLGVRTLPIPGSKEGDEINLGYPFGRCKIMGVNKFSQTKLLERDEYWRM